MNYLEKVESVADSKGSEFSDLGDVMVQDLLGLPCVEHSWDGLTGLLPDFLYDRSVSVELWVDFLLLN